MNIKEKIQLLDRLIVSYEQQYKNELEYNPDNGDFPTDEEAKPRTADKCYGLRFLTALRKVSILLTIRAEGTPADTKEELILLAQIENITMPNKALTEDAINVLAESVAGLSLTPFGREEDFREGFTTIEASVINQSRGISRIHSLAIAGDIVLLADVGGTGGSNMDITNTSTGAVVTHNASSSKAADATLAADELADATLAAEELSATPGGLVIPCVDDCSSAKAVFKVNNRRTGIPIDLGTSSAGRYHRSANFAKLLMSMITQELRTSPLPKSPHENPRYLRDEIETALTRMVTIELNRLSGIELLSSCSIRIGSTDNSPIFSQYEGLDVWMDEINTHRNTYNTDFIRKLDHTKVSALEELIASTLINEGICCSTEDVEDDETNTLAETLAAREFVDIFTGPLRDFCRKNFPELNTRCDNWISDLIQFPSNFLNKTCTDLNILASNGGGDPVEDISSSFCAKVFVAALTGFNDQHRSSASSYVSQSLFAFATAGGGGGDGASCMVPPRR